MGAPRVPERLIWLLNTVAAQDNLSDDGTHAAVGFFNSFCPTPSDVQHFVTSRGFGNTFRRSICYISTIERDFQGLFEIQPRVEFFLRVWIRRGASVLRRFFKQKFDFPHVGRSSCLHADSFGSRTELKTAVAKRGSSKASGPRFNGLHCRVFAFEELRAVPDTC